MRSYLRSLTLAFFGLALSAATVQAAEFEIKLSVLAPEGSTWVKEMEAMNQELQSLQNAILSPTSTLDYQVGYSGTSVAGTDTPLRSMLKKDANGVYTLLLVNIVNLPQQLKISLPGRPIELFAIDAQGARYPIGPYGSTLTDSIEGFGVRKYEFK